MNKFALIAVAGVLSTTAVSAADLAVAYQPTTVAYSPSSAFNWSGFYAGVNGGYGWGEFSQAGAVPLDQLKGVLGGVQVGYNYDLGGLVLGVEGDFQLANVKHTPVGGSFAIEQFGTVRARAGLAVDRFLPYVTGGLAVANANVNNSGVAPAYNENKVHVGWTVGAGVEFAATDNITLKTEYLYADFGKASYAGPAGGTGGDINVRAHIVRAGVNFKF